MSISFSGLASGLDTSSWVSSLTALKQAKVTTLQKQVEDVSNARDTLSNIKSFFTAFRSKLEKITDSKFKISSMDIFAKKVASSSRATVVTATANSEAVEGSYEVKVNQLATNTQVTSGYRYKTQIITTTQATDESYLKHIGITGGEIQVQHGGVLSTIEINANDTMNDLLSKFQEKGIAASYDNKTGIFSFDVGIEGIWDTGLTGFVDKLHLEGVNHGYKTENQLNIENVDTEYHIADRDTKLSDLGVTVGNEESKLTIEANGMEYVFALEENETMGSLIDAIAGENIEVSFADGVFSINNAVITNDGDTNLINSFGLENVVSNVSQASEGLQYHTVYIETTTATENSFIKDIAGANFTSGDTIEVKNNSGVITTITMDNSTTIGSLIADMTTAGLDVDFTDGALSIDDGWIVGGTYDIESAFGLEYTTSPSIVTGSELTQTITTHNTATLDSKLVGDLGATTGNVKIIDSSAGEHLFNVTENTTLQDFIDAVNGYGLHASYNSSTGVVTLQGGSYESVTEGSDLYNVLFGEDNPGVSSYANASSVSESLVVRTTETVQATSSTALSTLGIENGQTVTFNGSTTLDIDSSWTMNELVSQLRSAGLDASFDNNTGKLSIEGAEYTGSTGNFGAIMNFAETVTGKYETSSVIAGNSTTVGTNLTSAGVVLVTTTMVNGTQTVGNAATGGEISYITTSTVGATQSGSTMSYVSIGETTTTIETTSVSIETTGIAQTGGVISYVEYTVSTSATAQEGNVINCTTTVTNTSTYTYTPDLTSATRMLESVVTTYGIQATSQVLTYSSYNYSSAITPSQITTLSQTVDPDISLSTLNYGAQISEEHMSVDGIPELDNNEGNLGAGTIAILSSEGYDAFITNINNGHDYSGQTIILGADINSTTTIATTGTFSGIFDGNGYGISELTTTMFNTISGGQVYNLRIHDSEIHDNAALAHTITANSSVNNIELDGVNVTGYGDTAGVANLVEGSEFVSITVTGCHIESTDLIENDATVIASGSVAGMVNSYVDHRSPRMGSGYIYSGISSLHLDNSYIGTSNGNAAGVLNTFDSNLYGLSEVEVSHSTIRNTGTDTENLKCANGIVNTINNSLSSIRMDNTSVTTGRGYASGIADSCVDVSDVSTYFNTIRVNSTSATNDGSTAVGCARLFKGNASNIQLYGNKITAQASDVCGFAHLICGSGSRTLENVNVIGVNLSNNNGNSVNGMFKNITNGTQTFNNCNVSGSIYNYGEAHGFYNQNVTGSNLATFNNCSVNVNMNATSASGFSYAMDNAEFTSCKVSGTITANAIYGFGFQCGTFTDCEVDADLIGNGTVAGFIIRGYNNITNCKVSGDIVNSASGENTYAFAQYVGYNSSTAIVTGCSVDSNISIKSTATAYGFSASVNGNSSVTNSKGVSESQITGGGNYVQGLEINESNHNFTESGLFIGENQVEIANSLTFSELAVMKGTSFDQQERLTLTNGNYISITEITTIGELRGFLSDNGINLSGVRGEGNSITYEGYNLIKGELPSNVKELLEIQQGTLQTRSINSSCTLDNFGIVNGEYAIETNNGNIMLTVNSSTTVGDVINVLSANNITASVGANGKFVYNADESNFVIAADLGLNALFNCSDNAINNKNILYGENNSTYQNISMDSQIGYIMPNVPLYANGVTITLSTTSGELHTIEMDRTSTLQNLKDELNVYGLDLSITGDGYDNRIKITDNNTHDSAYIISMNDDFKTAIGMSGVTQFNTTLTETTSITTTDIATADTTLSELGLDGSYTIQISDSSSIILDGGVSIQSVIDELQNHNVNASFENGKFIIEESDIKYNYITNMTSPLGDIIGISTGSDSYTIKPVQTVHTADSNTTLGELGLTQDGIITFSDNSMATVNTSNTIGDVVDILSAKMTDGTVTFNTSGVNTGKLTVDPNGGIFIKNLSAELQTALKFNAGDGNSYQVNVSQETIQQTFTGQSMTTITATASTTFGELGFGENETGYVRLADGTSINVTATTNIGDLRTSLAENGVNTSEITNGVVNLLDTGSNVITSISSNVAGILGWNSGYNETYTTGLNNNIATTETAMSTLGMNSDGIIVTTNGNITVHSSDTINDIITSLNAKGITSSFNNVTGQLTIGDEEDTAVVTSMTSNLSNALGNISVGENLSYTTQGVQGETNVSITANMTLSRLGVNEECAITVTGNNGGSITVNPDTTVQQFLDLMNTHGYVASLNSGILSLTATDNNYISADTGNLLDKFNINTPTYTTSVSNLGDTKITELKDSLGNALNISTGELGVIQNGIARTVTIEETDTLDTLASKLSSYGINMVYSNANNGSIRFTSSGNTYLQAVNNGSDFLSKIDADSWNTLTNISSSQLEYVTNPNNTISLGTKVVELRSSDGTSLDITTGTYKIISNGVTINKTITANTTIADLFSDLSQYGISANVDSNGQISLGSSSNTYLRYDGSAGESNIVDKLFSDWNFGNIYTSNALDVVTTPTQRAVRDTELSKLSSGPYIAGELNISNQATGTVSSITLGENATIGTFMDALTMHGFTSYLDSNGRVVIQNDGNKTITSPAIGGSNALEVLGIDTSTWEDAGEYGGSVTSQSVEMETDVAADRNTALSDLGITEGSFYIYSNGIRHEIEMSTDETLGSLFDTLNSYGLHTTLKKNGDTSTIIIQGTGDSYIAQSNSVGASNIIDVLGLDTYKQYNYQASLQTTEYVTTTVVASDSTFISDYNKVIDETTQLSEGTLAVNVNGQYSEIHINSYETFGSFIEKLDRAGIKASLNDGILQMETGNATFSVISDATTSNILDNLGLVYNENLGDFSASTEAVTQTVTTLEDRTLSVANYADMDTKLSLLNVTNGTLSLYRNGKKAVIQINSDEKISDLRTKVLNAYTEGDIDIKVEDGHLSFFTTGENVDIQVGSSIDSTNLSSICNFVQEDDGSVSSSKELYKINSSSRIMESGLFRRSAIIGDATAGDFIIGDATFTIDENTTIAGIIAQINSSEKSNASAYWDSIDGKMVITSRTTGASLVNIEAGTSNFTDLLGLTNTDRNVDGEVEITRINRDAQMIGNNSSFTINGTKFSSTSNVITSDVSRINGVTFNLKGLTGSESATVTVEKNKEAVSQSVQEFVDAYNELINAVDEEVSKDGSLSSEFTLKSIRNQIRNLVTSTYAGESIFRNLSAIGISTSAANGANISTTGIDTLYFDGDKFIQAYEKDSDSLKRMLIGDDISNGILSNIETVVENALTSASGYFASADNSFAKKIQGLNDKISKANKAVEVYRARLEAKFQSMDMLISQMQNQYNSFLTNQTK